jgi:hypothetical protein
MHRDSTKTGHQGQKGVFDSKTVSAAGAKVRTGEHTPQMTQGGGDKPKPRVPGAIAQKQGYNTTFRQPARS